MPFTDLTFPVFGIDVARGFAQQRPQTTPVGVNVRAFEPGTGRGRGGNRPGLTRFVSDAVPAGSELIQGLNVVIMTDTAALIGTPDFPPPDYVEDPSSPGPSTTWGSGTVNDDDPADIITGLTERSRNPGGPGSSTRVFPRRVRNGGNAKQPNKNSKRTKKPDVLDFADLGPTPRFMFIGFAEYAYNYNLGAGIQSTSTTFTGHGCYPYAPAVGLGPPTSAADLPDIEAQVVAYFARISYQNPSGVSLTRAWYVSASPLGQPAPLRQCSCDDIHLYGGYDGQPNNSVAC